MNKNKNLVFDELTEEDKKEYRELGKESLKIRLIIFLISILVFLLYTYGLYKEKSYILIVILYISCIWGGYVLYFLFPPIGIKYGRISKKTYKKTGKYSAAVYNVYFPKERKSMKDIWIIPTKKYPAPMVKDEVKVVKTKFGKFYTYVVGRGK